MANEGVISGDKGWIMQTLTLQHRRPVSGHINSSLKARVWVCFVCLDTVSHHSITLLQEVEANADHRKKGEEVEKQERGIKVNEFGSEAFELSRSATDVFIMSTIAHKVRKCNE